MRILVDMDGVMADLIPRWVELINQYYYTEVSYESIIDWEVSKSFPTLSAKQVYSVLNEPGLFIHLLPVRNSIASVKLLMTQGHEVVFVTHCKRHQEEKRIWLARYFGESCLRNLIICERKELIAGDFLIDDGLHNLEAWSKAHPIGTAICFHAPYNKSWSGITAYNWEEVLQIILRTPVNAN